MSVREDLETVLTGGTPQRTPLSVYEFFMGGLASLQEGWAPLLDRGLGICAHAGTVYGIEHGTESTTEDRVEGDQHYRIFRKTCPAGTLQRVTLNGWHHEDWIKTPADYKVRQWMVEHTENKPCYENFDKAVDLVGERGIVLVSSGRTPLMSINIDWAGTERFCEDVANEVPELFDLYQAQSKANREATEVMAKGPGQFVKIWENLTLSMIGPGRYRDYLMSEYRQLVPILEAGGKRVMVHYDGELKPIADQIATAPFHIIESLTEPPEGDMMLDECRAAWPDKVFWANLNVGLFNGPPAELRAAVIAKRQRAGKRALAFEISEDLPRNWKETVPVVLDTLEELG